MPGWRGSLIGLVWLVWGLYWLAASRDVKQSRRIESPLSRLAHIGPLIIAACLIAPARLPFDLLGVSLLPWPQATYFFGLAALLGGFAFTVWARLTLGRNWSAMVALKQGHELIRRGPYAFVRHPIYTGLLAMYIGSALARDEWRGVLGVTIVVVALWRKLRLEERWMIETFGDRYRAYRREVPALIPFT